jgi:hypothetical protein
MTVRVTFYRRLLALILSFLLAAGMPCSRATATDGEARLNFQVLPDGPAPANFGPGPALLITNPPDDAPTELRIVGGKLTNESTVSGRAAGYYTSASLGAPITIIGARWTFTQRGGTPGAMALVVSQTALPPLFRCIWSSHRICGASGYGHPMTRCRVGCKCCYRSLFLCLSTRTAHESMRRRSKSTASGLRSSYQTASTR